MFSKAQNIRKKPIRPAKPSCPTAQPISILITAATEETAQQLSPLLAQGYAFGPEQPILLHLYDEHEKLNALRALQQDLRNCSFPLLSGVLCFTDLEKAIVDVSVAFLCDDIEEDQIFKNDTKQHIIDSIETYRKYGMCLDRKARKDIKVLILGTPCSLNALVCYRYVKTIPKQNFTALARYDQNRTASHLMWNEDPNIRSMQNLAIWGNICGARFADARQALITEDVDPLGCTWVKNKEINDLHENSFEIVVGYMNKLAIPIAKAACEQMHDWWFGVSGNNFVSMSVLSDGSYDVPAGIFFSFPVQISKKQWKIVPDVELNQEMKEQLEVAAHELLTESKEVFKLCHVIDGKVKSREKRIRSASAGAAAMIAASNKDNGVAILPNAIKYEKKKKNSWDD